MPEHCPYCEGVLTDPPSCCVEAMNAHDLAKLQSAPDGELIRLWQDEGGEG